ncbi:acidic proline-rich protein PRP25-like isoform X2 [Corythoichthys intestinalis]|nr:acidic proline-rich protein PRP25-like isoform X2 [Corythoichthys intestinalis]
MGGRRKEGERDIRAQQGGCCHPHGIQRGSPGHPRPHQQAFRVGRRGHATTPAHPPGPRATVTAPNRHGTPRGCPAAAGQDPQPEQAIPSRPAGNQPATRAGEQGGRPGRKEGGRRKQESAEIGALTSPTPAAGSPGREETTPQEPRHRKSVGPTYRPITVAARPLQ